MFYIQDCITCEYGDGQGGRTGHFKCSGCGPHLPNWEPALSKPYVTTTTESETEQALRACVIQKGKLTELCKIAINSFKIYEPGWEDETSHYKVYSKALEEILKGAYDE